MLPQKYERFRKEIFSWVRKGLYKLSEGGVLINDRIPMQGLYKHYERRHDNDFRLELVEEGHNVTVNQGRALILNTFWGATAKPAAIYVSPFTNATDPVAATWTGANWAGGGYAGELSNNNEGYSQTVRQTWVPGTGTYAVIDNSASKASFTIRSVTAAAITINGYAVTDNNTKGGTAGNLIAAYRLASPRIYYDADIVQDVYSITWP